MLKPPRCAQIRARLMCPVIVHTGDGLRSVAVVFVCNSEHVVSGFRKSPTKLTVESVHVGPAVLAANFSQNAADSAD